MPFIYKSKVTKNLHRFSAGVSQNKASTIRKFEFSGLQKLLKKGHKMILF